MDPAASSSPLVATLMDVSGLTIYFVVAAVLTYVLVGFPMIAALAVVELVCVVLAAVHASRGESYRYPFSLRLVT